MREGILRKYPRIASHVTIQIQRLSTDKPTEHYLNGLATDCSLGGMFISTGLPLSPGDFINLEFRLKSESEDSPTIKARAVVRWIRQWKKPRGMGIEFIEFHGMGKKNYTDWLTELTGEVNQGMTKD